MRELPKQAITSSEAVHDSRSDTLLSARRDRHGLLRNTLFGAGAVAIAVSATFAFAHPVARIVPDGGIYSEQTSSMARLEAVASATSHANVSQITILSVSTTHNAQVRNVDSGSSTGNKNSVEDTVINYALISLAGLVVVTIGGVKIMETIAKMNLRQWREKGIRGMLEEPVSDDETGGPHI